MDRRSFLRVSASAALARAVRAAAPPRPPGLQLFTVLSLLEADFEGTIREVAAIGYREVETIGSFGRDPVHVREILSRHGLTSPSQHIAPARIYSSFSAWAKREISTEQNRENFIKAFTFEQTDSLIEDAIRSAKALGQKYIIWQILFEPHLASRPIIDQVIRTFNRAGETCQREGLVFAFHNHDREFARVGNDVPYDLILANTDPERVKLELDFYWITKAKADPLAYLRKHVGRYRLCHVKDMDSTGDFAVVGMGVLDVPALLDAARTAGVEHFYVEYDRPLDPMREIRQSYSYLAGLK